VYSFPPLAEKATRLQELGEALFDLRMDVANQERALMERAVTGAERAEYDALVARRTALGQELAALPGADAKYGERVKMAKDRYQEVEGRAKEVEVTIASLEAELVAIEKYWRDTDPGPGARKLDEQLFNGSVAAIRTEVAELKKELLVLQDELVMAKDQAGLGDDIGEDARRIRAEMLALAKQEHELMQRMMGRLGGSDAQLARDLAGAISQIDGAQAVLDRVYGKIEGILDTELAGVRAELEVEKASLADGKAKLAQYDGENVVLGSEVIAGSFASVSKKFYDITLRAEVGIIDVSWSRKEESENNFNRIEVDSAREKRTLQSEFSEVANDPVEEAPQPAPTAPEGGNVSP
jgi:chromosome segregation ATPase